jgi:hypothetical protein
VLLARSPTSKDAGLLVLRQEVAVLFHHAMFANHWSDAAAARRDGD